MSSGKPIDWSKFDDLIKLKLPTTTITILAAEIGCSGHALGQRAKLLGITPAKYRPTTTHKSATADGVRKPLSETVYEHVRLNHRTSTRKQMARDLNISLHLVNRAMNELGLEPNVELAKTVCIEAGKANCHVGAAAFAAKMSNDQAFRTKFSSTTSANNRKLWQDEEYRLKVRNGQRRVYQTTDLRERLSAINRERYLNDPRVRAVLMADRPFKNSKLNDDVATCLDSLGLRYEREFEIGWHKFDFRIGDLLLEVNGDYWHSLPNNIANDRAKATLVERYCPELALRVLWESEFRSVRGQQRLQEVIGFIGIEPQPISLANLTFTNEPDIKTIDKFLISFHYLGTSNRKRHQYALLLHGEIVAVAVFGQLVRQNIASGRAIELVRLCRHPRFYNRNMLSSFLSKCCKYLESLKRYDQIISYADARLHEGTVYRACNWTDEGLTEPDYQYMSVTNVPMHKKTLYNRARAEGLKEREYADLYGFRKTDVGSKRRFTKSLH